MQWDLKTGDGEPEAVNMMLPPLNVLPLEGFVRIIACEACLIAKKQLRGTPQ